MRGLIWIIMLFAAAVGVAIAAHHYSGNVYVQIDQTLVRMNLHLFIVGLLVSVCTLYFLVKLLFGVLATPGKIGRFGSSRKYRKAVDALNQAGVAYFEGRYPKAAHEAARVLANKHAGDNRVLALLIAAECARQNGESSQLSRYLNEIAEKLPAKSQLPRHLLSADVALSKGDFAEAQTHLDAAEDLDRHLSVIHRLQLRLAVAKADAPAILEQADKLQKAGAMAEEEALRYRQTAYGQLVEAADSAAAMKNILKRLPNAQKAGELCVAVAEQYEKLGLYADAVAWVGSYYPHTRHNGLLPVLLNSMRYLDDGEQRKLINAAEGWLKNHPEDAALLMYLGELTYSKQLWGKAQSYFEASIAVKPTVQARLGLAKVFDEINAAALADEQRQLVLGEMTQA